VLDNEDVEILRAAARNEQVLRPHGSSRKAAKAFDHRCKKAVELHRRGLLEFGLLDDAKSGSPGLYSEVQIGGLTPAGERELAKYTPPTDTVVIATRRVIRSALGRRDSQFGQMLSGRMQGVSSSSSAFLTILREATKEELRGRGAYVLDTWVNFLGAQGKVPTKDVVELIRLDIESSLDAIDVLWSRYMSPGRIGTKPTKADFAKLTVEPREELEATIDIGLATGTFILSETKRGPAVTTSQDNRITVHGSVGAIMTGTGATATVNVGIAPDGLAGLVSALTELRSTLLSAGNTAIEQQQEVVGVIDSALAEAQKPEPNRLSLAGLVSAAGGAIRTTAAVPGAYNALKSAAAMAGIELP
jgi:hypothetical protein